MNLRIIILVGLLLLTSCPVSFAMQQKSMAQLPAISNKMKYLGIRAKTKFIRQKATDGTITTTRIPLGKMIFNPLQLTYEKPITLNDVDAYSANIAGLTNILGVVGVVGLDSMKKVSAIIVFPSKSLFLKGE